MRKQALFFIFYNSSLSSYNFKRELIESETDNVQIFLVREQKRSSAVPSWQSESEGQASQGSVEPYWPGGLPGQLGSGIKKQSGSVSGLHSVGKEIGDALG